MFLLVATILGLCVGALMNAFVLRTKETLAFTVGRSCAVCAVPANIGDGVPIVGYAAMRGKCRKCKSVVPAYYLFIELLMGGAFLCIAWSMLARDVSWDILPWLFARDAALTAALVFVGAFDLFARVIPDRITVPAILIVAYFNIALGMPVLMLLLGGSLIGAFFAIQMLLSKGTWAGGGDVRMGILMGVALGPAVGLLALFISYILGGLVGSVILLLRKGTAHTRVPFGVFMAIATFFCIFFGEFLVEWYSMLLN
jgi:leader peptidase (prepilin peptidase)/N-methyltransferase